MTASVPTGSSWPDVCAVSALEGFLGVILWLCRPDRPQRGQPKDGSRTVGPVGDQRGEEANAAGAAGSQEAAGPPRARDRRTSELDSHGRSTF
nr:hypothetical protein [Streptomyces sp. 846.5]